MFEQNIESELDDSSGKYKTAAERNSLDRRADAVRDVICDVTYMIDNFQAQTVIKGQTEVRHMSERGEAQARLRSYRGQGRGQTGSDMGQAYAGQGSTRFAPPLPCDLGFKAKPAPKCGSFSFHSSSQFSTRGGR